MSTATTSHEAAFMRRVTEVRVARSMSQTKLADLMIELGHRWSQSAVWALENGHRRLLFDEAVDLTALLDLPMPGCDEPPNEARMRSEANRARSLLEARQLINDLSRVVDGL